MPNDSSLTNADLAPAEQAQRTRAWYHFAALWLGNLVFIGDTLGAESSLLELRASKSRPDAGLATFEHRMFNQRGALVC